MENKLFKLRYKHNILICFTNSFWFFKKFNYIISYKSKKSKINSRYIDLSQFGICLFLKIKNYEK